MRYDWPFKKRIVNLPINLKGKSKRISGNSGNIGAVSQTLLTRVRLWLWRRLSGGYFLLPEIIVRLTFLVNHPMSNKLRRWKPRKVWHLVRRSEGCLVLSDGNKENLSSFKHRCSECRTCDVTNSLHTLLEKHLSANQSRRTRLVIL